jgi:exoribonuclease R
MDNSDRACEPVKGILHTKDYRSFYLIQPHSTIPLQIPEIQSVVGCLPGDEIQYQADLKQFKVINSAKHRKIVGILELTSKTRYGLTSRGYNKYLFRPMNSSYPPFIVGSSQKDLTKNMLCSINLKNSHWDSYKTTFPEGEIVEYFGPVGDWKSERQALLDHWCPLRNNSSDKVTPTNPEEDAKRYIIGSIEEEINNTFHIDPPGCRDVDDILTIYYDKGINADNKFIRCIITIADVAYLINRMDTKIIETAQEIGSTFYDENGRVLVPMLPNKISEDYLSLHDNGKEKYGISLEIGIRLNNDGQGQIENHNIYLSKILPGVVKTFTYESFQENNWKFGKRAQEVYSTLEKALGRNGTKGMDETDGAHAFVEATMLYYNWYVGNYLANSPLSSNIPYRSQEQMDANRLKKWMSLSASQSMNFEGLGSEPVAPAKYVFGAGSQHHTLGLKNYCHASSPIRRFCDLWIQFQLHLILRNHSENYYGVESWRKYNRILELLNTRSISQKKFSKQLGLLSAVEKGQRDFHGICLDWIESKDSLTWKGKILLEEIGIIYTVRQLADKPRPLPGTKVNIKIGLNLSESTWKRRFIPSIISKC